MDILVAQLQIHHQIKSLQWNEFNSTETLAKAWNVDVKVD